MGKLLLSMQPFGNKTKICLWDVCMVGLYYAVYCLFLLVAAAGLRINEGTFCNNLIVNEYQLYRPQLSSGSILVLQESQKPYAIHHLALSSSPPNCIINIIDGSKKILSDHEMPEAYHPPYVEAAWEEWW